MKTTLGTPTRLLLALLLIASATAGHANSIVYEFNWTGQLTISGFSALGLLNPDGNSFTMKYEWEIDDGSSQFIGLPTGVTTITTGTVQILNVLSPGDNMEFPSDSVPQLAALLPVGTVAFPPGQTPAVNLVGSLASPLLTLNINEPNFGVDSALLVTDLEFADGLLTYDLTEVKNNPGAQALAGLFILADGVTSGGDADGAISRDFIMNVQVSEVSAVPLPAAIWLFLPAIAGLGATARRRKVLEK